MGWGLKLSAFTEIKDFKDAKYVKYFIYNLENMYILIIVRPLSHHQKFTKDNLYFINSNTEG